MNDLNSVFTPEVLTKLARIGGKNVPSNGRDIHRPAFKCGVLPNEDLVGRLQSTNDNNFRSGVAECLSAWYLGGLGFDVKPRPESTSQRNVDLLLTKGDVSIYTEVKAPYEPVPLVGGWAGDDSAALLRCVMDAGKNQLKPGRANLLVITDARLGISQPGLIN